MVDALNISAPAAGHQGRDVSLVKQGNLLYLAGNGGGGADEMGKLPAPEDALRLLRPELTYMHRDFLYGAKRYDRGTGRKKSPVQVSERRLFDVDAKGRLRTTFGFLVRVSTLLKQAGFRVRYFDLDRQLELEKGHPRPDRYQLDLGNVTYHFRFRERQDKCLEALAGHPNGVVHAVTGFGKMALIVMACLLYPRARIHVVTRRLPLVNKLVEYLTRYVPNVGQYGDGVKRPGDRVTVFSSCSLHHSDFDADILLCDEAHELLADKAAAVLARYQSTRNYAFTATPTGRSDGADVRLEALFGRRIFYLPYWEAAELGLVVPICVRWRDVALDHNPAANIDDPIDKKRAGVWFNARRNDILAASFLEPPPEEQRLLLTDTVYHAVEVYKRVRHALDVTLVYDQIDLARFDAYKALAALPADLPRMTSELKEYHRKRFEAGEGHYISTPTWEVGVDPTHLQHLYIGSSFRSEIKAQQAPGRASRINAKSGKQVGYVHDLRDQFERSFWDAARERFKIYAAQRWEQVVDLGGSLAPITAWR